MEQLALVRKEVRRADLVRHRPAAAQPRRPMHDTMLRDRRARHTNVGHPVQAVTRKLARRRQGWRWLFTMYPPCLLLHSVDTCAHGHAHGLLSSPRLIFLFFYFSKFLKDYFCYYLT